MIKGITPSARDRAALLELKRELEKRKFKVDASIERISLIILKDDWSSSDMRAIKRIELQDDFHSFIETEYPESQEGL